MDLIQELSQLTAAEKELAEKYREDIASRQFYIKPIHGYDFEKNKHNVGGGVETHPMPDEDYSVLGALTVCAVAIAKHRNAPERYRFSHAKKRPLLPDFMTESSKLSPFKFKPLSHWIFQQGEGIPNQVVRYIESLGITHSKRNIFVHMDQFMPEHKVWIYQKIEQIDKGRENVGKRTDRQPKEELKKHIIAEWDKDKTEYKGQYLRH